MVGTQDYYSCHLWSMNMKRSNYLGVTLWMDKVCKYILYSWWWITLHCKGQRGSEWYWRWTPPVVSSVTINSSPRVAFIRLYWWQEHRHHGFLQQPHKWWRQMDIDLIKSGPDYMKIEGGNWRRMHAMAANSTLKFESLFQEFHRAASQQIKKRITCNFDFQMVCSLWRQCLWESMYQKLN